MKRISKVILKKIVDTDGDFSTLGEYSSQVGPNAIDREERGDMGRGEYRYFNPAISGEESGNPDSPEEDYQRCEAYNRNEWWYVGIRAEAVIETSDEGSTWLRQAITSGGVWGIESDSDDEYFSEIGGEELDQLKGTLLELGFTSEDIDAAFATVKQSEGVGKGAEDYKFIDG